MSEGTSNVGGASSAGSVSPGAASAGARRSTRGADGRLKPFLIVLALMVLAVPVILIMRGCDRDVATQYGSRQALLEGDQSINGLGVLAEMFVQAGHRVASTARLSPKIGRSADVIVWFIQDFTPPSQQAVDWLEDWLEDEPERTLIVVGRDFDAEPLYWSKVTPQANAQQVAVVTSKGSLAALRVATERTPTATQPEDWGWFKLDRSAALKQRGITTLTGDAGWTAGVDPTKVEIELNGRITPKDDDDEILLETAGDVLVFRHRPPPSDWSTPPPMNDDLWEWMPSSKALPKKTAGSPTPSSKMAPKNSSPMKTPQNKTSSRKAWSSKALSSRAISTGSGQVIVVTNGSFLLNMPLVNHEHRKLAGALINEVGPKRRVFFLETGGKPEVLAEDPPPPRLPSSTMYFDVPRIQNLLWHLAVFTLIVCFGLFAIHGRPRRAARASPAISAGTSRRWATCSRKPRMPPTPRPSSPIIAARSARRRRAARSKARPKVRRAVLPRRRCGPARCQPSTPIRQRDSPSVSQSALHVLYEDNHLLAINKPAGLATMGLSPRETSLFTLAKDYLKRKYHKPGNVYLGVVSRLDAAVSGVVLLARTSKAAARLSERFRERDVEKVYWAIVEGSVEPPEGELHDWLVKDEPRRRMRKCDPGTLGARDASLSYRRLATMKGDSLLEIRLHTGRKHQIRVQLAAVAHPILGDRKYGSHREFARGIALHARRLVVPHPVGRAPMVEIVAPVPDDWPAIA